MIFMHLSPSFTYVLIKALSKELAQLYLIFDSLYFHFEKSQSVGR